MTHPDAAGTLGKTRTWWHPLLVRLLQHTLSPAFEVREEVSVGTLPLRADIVLLRREQAEIPELATRSLPALVERLNRWTPIEFKSPVDSLDRGDLDRLLGVAHLFRAQQAEASAASELSVMILAASITGPFEADAQHLGLRLIEDETGVWRIDGGLFRIWLLEADRLDEPALTVFSRVFLRDPQLIMEMVRNPDTQPILRYVYQQIQQFQTLGEAFMVQHTHTAEMDQEYAAFKDAFLDSLTLEERLAGLSPEERLAGLSPEEIRRVLSAEELPAERWLEALTPEERKRLFERLCDEGLTPPDKQSPE